MVKFDYILGNFRAKDRVKNPTEGDIVLLDAKGLPVDSGLKLSDFSATMHKHPMTDVNGLPETLAELRNNFTDYPKAIQHVTYAQLVTLRNNSELVPGQWYRITDYITTVANDTEARSAGHPFDILVMALTNSQLAEEGCYAIYSERDEDGYFANAKLAAWKISYCLDNDLNRFMWADTDNGTGVIYRMVDEWLNSAPYDFKNIQFKRYKVTDPNEGTEKDTGLNGLYAGTNAEMQGLYVGDYEDFVWCYTYSFGDRTTTPIDASLIGFNSDELSEGHGYKGYYSGSIIKPCSCYQSIDDEQYSVFCLNNVVWFTNNIKYRASINGSLVEEECINMTLSGCYIHIGGNSQNIIMGDGCYNVSIKAGGYCLIFGQNCGGMQFGQDCHHFTFGQSCFAMQFGQNCVYLTFGQGCNWITVGQNCVHLTFGRGCHFFTFERFCGGMQFGQNCSGMQFGQNCFNLTFGQNCSGMQFVQNCFNLTFGQNVRNLTVDNDVQYIEVPNYEEDSYIQNAHIFSGVRGGYGDWLILEIPANLEYTQFVAMKSDGKVRIWNPADAV